ncbi:MAG TPA: hypothetical protein VGK67_32260 [Myxococcales bacterium]
MNLDPEAAAAEYRDKMVKPYRGVLPEATVRSMEVQLSGSCTMCSCLVCTSVWCQPL